MQPPSYQNPYSSPFGGGSIQSSRNPWQRFSQMSPYQAGAGAPGQLGMPSLGSFMQGQGYSPTGQGGFAQQGARSSSGLQGPQYTMSQGAAQQHRAAAYGAGREGMAAAGQDFDALRDIVNTENVQRENLRGRLAGGFDAARADGVAGAQQELTEGYAEADKIEAQGGKDYETYAEFRDQGLDFAKGEHSSLKADLDSYVENYNENAMGSISAAHSGMMQGAQTQIQQLEAQARMSGASPEATQAQVANIREQAMRQSQSVIAPMMDKKNQFKMQARMQAAGVRQASAANIGSQYASAGQTTASMLQHRGQMKQAAQGYRKAARADAASRKLQFDQLALQYGQAEAGVLQNLGQRYPSAYDSFLQMGYARQAFGGQSSMYS